MIKHIQVGRDTSCEMAIVLIDGECVMGGNYWDFHPGCHGVKEYGDFNGVDSLVQKVKTKLTSMGNEVVIDAIAYKYGTPVAPIQVLSTPTPTKKILKRCLTNVEGDNKVAP